MAISDDDYVLTPEELSALERVLERARADAERGRVAAVDPINCGDVVQLRPGANYTWETSFMLVKQSDARKVRGQILRPHRGGCREAWYTFNHAEVVRVGHSPFPEPAAEIKSSCYFPPCPIMASKAEIETFRDRHHATQEALKAEMIEVARLEAQSERLPQVRGRKGKRA